MKKKIALLLLLALALTVILAACRQTEPTKIIPRWDEKGESYVYTISLSDFNISDEKVSDTHFRSYTNAADSNDYYKDFDVRVGEPLNALDEVRPIAATGTFELTIAYSAETKCDTVSTKQYLELTYDNKDGELIDESVLKMMRDNGLIVSEGDGKITLKSTTETTVVFTHDEKQAPRTSSMKVNGFYVGKAHQEVSNYEISTEYTYESKNTVVASKLTQYVEKDGDMKEETTEIKETLKRRTAGTFIDSNQIFTYTRSFDKLSGSFADSPTVSVYDPLSKTLQTANFTYTSAAKAMLTDGTRGENGESLFAKIPTVGVTVGGMPFMLQESLPNLLDDNGNGPDSAYYGTFNYAKHTPVRFRVRYVSYELAQYEDVIWEALKSAASSDK